VKSCDVPARIAGLTYADLTEARDTEAEFGKLLDALRGSRRLPQTAPVAVGSDTRDRTRIRASEDSEQLGKGLNALSSLIWAPQVRTAVAEFRRDFRIACEQIDVLGDYKDLHDVLHDVQDRCYKPLLPKVRVSTPQDLDWDELASYELELTRDISRMQIISARPSIDASLRSPLEDLVRGERALQEAVESLDLSQLHKAVWFMKSAIATQPSRINTLLNTAARTLRLPSLVAAMSCIKENMTRAELDRDRVTDFQVGLESLTRLNETLNALVYSHDRWQEMDDKLRLLEDTLDKDVDELKWSWPYVKLGLEQLCMDSGDEWGPPLLGDCAKLDDALAAKDPMKIKQFFRRVRSRESQRFYLVDLQLKELCGELRKIGQPLAAILEKAE